jgi:hypothetical protein
LFHALVAWRWSWAGLLHPSCMLELVPVPWWCLWGSLLRELVHRPVWLWALVSTCAWRKRWDMFKYAWCHRCRSHDIGSAPTCCRCRNHLLCGVPMSLLFLALRAPPLCIPVARMGSRCSPVCPRGMHMLTLKVLSWRSWALSMLRVCSACPRSEESVP